MNPEDGFYIAEVDIPLPMSCAADEPATIKTFVEIWTSERLGATGKPVFDEPLVMIPGRSVEEFDPEKVRIVSRRLDPEELAKEYPILEGDAARAEFVVVDEAEGGDPCPT